MGKDIKILVWAISGVGMAIMAGMFYIMYKQEKLRKEIDTKLAQQ